MAEQRAPASGPSERDLLSPWAVARVMTVVVVIMVGAAAALGALAFSSFRVVLEPEIRSKVGAVATTLARDFAIAEEHGIALGKLRGVDELLDATLATHPELRYAAIADPSGRLVGRSRLLRPMPDGESSAGRLDADEVSMLEAHFRTVADGQCGRELGARLGQFEDVACPVGKGGSYATIHLGLDAHYVRNALLEIGVDVAITIFVALVIGLEALLVLLQLTVARPMSLLGRLVAAGKAGRFDALAPWRARDELGRAVRTVNAVIEELNRRFAALRRSADARVGSVAEALGERFRFAPDPKAIDTVELRSPNDVRLPLFVFLFGTELSRAFFPMFVGDLYIAAPIPGVSRSLAIALPMSLWVVAMVLATSVAGRLAERLGWRDLLLWGMALSSLGLALTAVAGDLYELLAWRSLTAVGFGLVTMVSLLYIDETSSQARRASGMSVFVAALTAASVCGSSLGGILADRVGDVLAAPLCGEGGPMTGLLGQVCAASAADPARALGYRGTFAIAAGLVVVSMLLAASSVPQRVASTPAREAATGRRHGSFTRIAFGSKGMVLMVLAAIPAKIVLTGLLFYLVPLHLAELGYSPAAIGRVLMTYFVLMFVLVPLASAVSDRWDKPRALVLAGTVASALGAIALGYELWRPQMEGMCAGDECTVAFVVFGVALIGVGQAVTQTPLLALVPSVFHVEVERYGLPAVRSVVRIVERAGSILGPLVVAATVVQLAVPGEAAGYSAAAAAIGAAMLLAAVPLAIYLLASGRDREGEGAASGGGTTRGP